jgi:hypothetical protein
MLHVTMPLGAVAAGPTSFDEVRVLPRCLPLKSEVARATCCLAALPPCKSGLFYQIFWKVIFFSNSLDRWSCVKNSHRHTCVSNMKLVCQAKL